MASVGAVFLAISFVGYRLTTVRISYSASLLVGVLVLSLIMLPLPAYWQEKGKRELRDAALTLPWFLFLKVVLSFIVVVSGRSGMGIGLKDEYFAHLDQSLGVHVPSMMAWASQNWFGRLIDRSYSLLTPLLLVSFFLPALTGKAKQARFFITANVVAFTIGMPMFALFPAVGPWYGYHLAATASQAACQRDLFFLRAHDFYTMHSLGVVCFPSFHVIWAIFAVILLWYLKALRIPVVILSGTIILSTMTCGWHYFVDVLAGIVVAGISIAISRSLDRWYSQ
jgi:membrane-associated phospholipid phosphatase